MFDPDPQTDEEVMLRFKRIFHREMTQEEMRALFVFEDRAKDQPKENRSDKAQAAGLGGQA